MKLAVSNIGWDSCMDESMYDFLQAQEIRFLEIAPSRIFPVNPYCHIEEAMEFSLNLKKKYNLAICSMQSIWYGKTQKIVGPKKDRNELLDYTKYAIKFAVAIGCSNLVFGCPKNRVITALEDIKIVEDFLLCIAEEAWNNGVMIALEANPTIYQTNFVNTTIEACNLVKRLNHPGLKINLDVSTILVNDESLDFISSHIGWINHVHISEAYLKPLQRRLLHNQLYEILKINGYENCISLEMAKPENMQSLYQSIVYMKEVFS